MTESSDTKITHLNADYKVAIIVKQRNGENESNGQAGLARTNPDGSIAVRMSSFIRVPHNGIIMLFPNTRNQNNGAAPIPPTSR